MPLLTASDCAAFVRSDLTPDELQRVINREEARLVRKLGPHGDGLTPVTLTVRGSGGNLFLARPVVSVASVGGATSGWTLYADQGRITGATWPVDWLTAGGGWDGTVAVVCVLENDQDDRRAALIDLVRLAVQRTAMKSESVAGEYSYSAPDWEAERAAIYRRLMFSSV